MDILEMFDRCIVEHCGVDDSEFVAAVMNDSHVVIANAEPIAAAVLGLPVMQEIKAILHERAMRMVLKEWTTEEMITCLTSGISTPWSEPLARWVLSDE